MIGESMGINSKRRTGMVLFPATPQGQCKKLHQLWSGPYKIIHKLSDVTYCIQNVRAHWKRIVVHFDRLKWCPPNMRMPDKVHSESTQQKNNSPPKTLGQIFHQLKWMIHDHHPDTPDMNIDHQTTSHQLFVIEPKYETYSHPEGSCVITLAVYADFVYLYSLCLVYNSL